ncbi:methyl-accepting chemotaxis protein [Aquabacterium sp.]|uniref:methyl-accepting chemotaxis protein n=1 Tax=Aquabacterium sp. TaxID=1872578 RepID=UPI0035B00134
MKFNDLRVGSRLGLGFALVLLLAVLMAAFGGWQVNAIKRNFDDVALKSVPSIQTASRMQNDMHQMRRWELRLLTDHDPDKRKAAVGKFNEFWQDFQAQHEHYGKDLLSDETDRRLWTASRETALAAVASFEKVRGELDAANGDPAKLKSVSDYVGGPELGIFSAADEAMKKIVEYNDHLAAEAVKTGHADYQLALSMLGGMALLSLAVGALAAWVITRSITVPLGVAMSVTERVAAGRFDNRIDTSRNDELGQLARALDGMQSKLRGVIDDIRAAAESVTSASGQIAAGNQDLSSRTEHQASSLQQTAASMQQLTENVQHNTDSARQASAVADSVASAAERGSDVVGRVVSTMQTIQHSSHKISEIIGVIDGIAFQTNILALNAAVEAARAGEQGRGFAVVASEVRNLAQRSANAAKEIKTLITDSVEHVNTGAGLVGDAGQTMGELQTQVRRVTDLMNEIRAASIEQSTSLGEVNQAVSQLDQATQQNAALVEESAAAAESLRQQADRMLGSISAFTTGR